MRRVGLALPLAIAIAAAAPAVSSKQPPAADQSKIGAGAWSAANVLEPESVEEVPAAVVETAAGFTFAVAREPGASRVLGILCLPPADQDMLDDTRSSRSRSTTAARARESAAVSSPRRSFSGTAWASRCSVRCAI